MRPVLGRHQQEADVWVKLALLPSATLTSTFFRSQTCTLYMLFWQAISRDKQPMRGEMLEEAEEEPLVRSLVYGCRGSSYGGLQEPKKAVVLLPEAA